MSTGSAGADDEEEDDVGIDEIDALIEVRRMVSLAPPALGVSPVHPDHLFA